MADRIRAVATSTAVVMFAVACSKVPFTDRKQFNAIPEGVMNNIGASTYDEMLASAPVTKKGRDADLLRRVGNRIAEQADKPNYDWTYSMIDTPDVNAWCLPGGYIGFYNGILPVLGNESGMAFVMGHEVGHAVAKHGSERMSQQLGVMGGLGALDLFLSGSGKVSQQQRGLIMSAVGLGAQYGVLLPFSRSHEKEADTIGMMYMAGAGYPPAESMDVWRRMEAIVGSGPPAFLSTHPSFKARTDNQKEWLPEAAKRYRRNKMERDTRTMIWGAPK